MEQIRNIVLHGISMTNTLPTNDGGKSTLPSDPATQANEAFSYFGDPPLVAGEDRRKYSKFLDDLIASVKPTDIFENIWVGEYAYLHWEVIRLRRISVGLINTHYAESKADPLPRFGRSGTDADRDGDIAEIVARHIDVLNSLEGMTATAELRRNAAYREIERHRAGLGDRVNRAVEQLGNAQSPRKLQDNSGDHKRAA
jgi:hypothetical protein